MDLQVETLENVEDLRKQLLDTGRPLTERFRALYSLRHMASNGDHAAVDAIALGFEDSSNLLKHELAYCLGQTKDLYCVPILQRLVAARGSQDDIVRHEAAEALGALGDTESLELLRQYRDNDAESRELRETCELAVARIEWASQPADVATESAGQVTVYDCIDPAPPTAPAVGMTIDEEIKELDLVLQDQNVSLFNRYRAMFRLRDIGTQPAIDSIGHALLHDPSALLRHECAFVFGQMSHHGSSKYLLETLSRTHEEGMVRHEAAEALGSIGTEDVLPALMDFRKDAERIVSESCVVAIDMWEYENGQEVEYAATAA